MTIRITAFEWDELNSRHIEFHSEHPVSRDIIEEMFAFGEFRVRKTKSDRYMALGHHPDGYYLAVVFANKGGGTVRPISARGMAPWEKKLYRRK